MIDLEGYRSLSKSLRRVVCDYAEATYSTGYVRVHEMARDCANALDELIKECEKITSVQNLPLSQDQLSSMPQMAAVWVYFSPKYDLMILSAKDALRSLQEDTMCKTPLGSLFFASIPSQEDIDKGVLLRGTADD